MSYPFEPQRARRRGMPRDLELDLAAEEIVRQWLDGKGASRIAAERGVTLFPWAMTLFKLPNLGRSIY